MPPIVNEVPNQQAYFVKGLIDEELTMEDGFESYLFNVGEYNNAVGNPFKLPYDPDTICVLIISTPNMFDVSFKRWIQTKFKEKFDVLNVDYELFHDHSLWPSRKPKILMQTCGHVAGAAYYYQPFQVRGEGWPPLPMPDNKKFIGLSLHPVYGGHFAFRSVFIFPNLRFSSFRAPEPLSILHSTEEIRDALERFNYNWKNSGFRDFGGPRKRYSVTQMEFFGLPPAERWSVLKQWCEG
ncbi:MMACHC-like family protein [Teladorsagia circumcincta]|uniref:Cyanocobalamin reductase (cyanide-eliminating) n=1 Tax=Teladorsagia circumcincta TaxID=45464 RepID=A0A2G9TVS2_TELCI|nr:MMACHC-like family protein [Teladorsagia circumcincta]